MKGLSEYIPYSSHITPEIIKLRGGNYMICFHLEGAGYVGKDQVDIDHRIQQINKLIKQMKAPLRYNLYVHSHCIRHEYSPELDDSFESGSFAADFNDAYVSEKIRGGNPAIKSDYYISVIYRPVVKIGGYSIYGNTRKQIRIFEEKAETELNKIRNLFLDFFEDYQIKTLSTFERNDILYSEQLQFLNMLLNLNNKDVPVMKAQIFEYLPTVTLSMGNNGYISIENNGKKQYASIITISEYPGETSAGALQPFLELPWRMIVSQVYVPLDKSEAVSWLKREHRRLESFDDASDAEIEGLETALKAVQGDDYVVGEFYWSAMLIADDLQTLQSMIAEGTTVLSDCGFTASVNVLGKLNSYCAQLPGNIKRNLRSARIPSVNVIDLMPFHRQNRGKQYGNPWGCAVSMLRTVNDEVFYFNFHDTEKDSNDKNQKPLGNTVISGQSGTGKTVLLSFLMAQAQRYKTRPKTIFFDKDLGASVFIRAMRGKYSQIKLGEPTGFNPFHLPDSATTRQFLATLIKSILANDGLPLTPAEKVLIENAIEQTMLNPKELRDIEAFSNYLPSGENSLRERLYAWTNGEYAWIFNNPEDNFTLEDNNFIGIDYTEFLDNKEIRSPILMYLFYRIELILDGQPVLIPFDEAWKPFQDPEFASFIEDKQRTIRKQNGVIIYSTQSPSDFYRYVPPTFFEQIAVEIYLPNPKAKYDDYVTHLGLQEEEYFLIKNMRKNSREFLIRYQGETTHCKLDLKGIPAVDVFSGSKDRALQAESLIKRHGENWLDEYYRTVKQLGDKHEELEEVS